MPPRNEEFFPMRFRWFLAWILCATSAEILVAEDAVAERYAVLLGVPSAREETDGAVRELTWSLQRNGYQRLPNRPVATWMLDATRPACLALPVNLLKFRPAGGELLVVCTSSLSLDGDVVRLSANEGPGVNLFDVLEPLAKLEPRVWSINVVLVASSVAPWDTLLAVLRSRIPQSLSALIGQSLGDDTGTSDKMFTAMRRVLSYDRRADEDRDGVVTMAELGRRLRHCLAGHVRIGWVAAREGKQIRFARYEASTLEEAVGDLGEQLAEIVQRKANHRVAIPDFPVVLADGRVDAAGFLHRFLVEQLRSWLAARSYAAHIVPHDQLVSSLNMAGLTPASSDDDLVKLGTTVGAAGPLAILRGEGRLDVASSPPTLDLEFRVVCVRFDGVVDSVPLAPLRATLVRDEAAMSGAWNMSPKRDTFPGLDWDIGALGGPVDLAPHPMSNPEFPLRVHLRQAGRNVMETFSDDKRQLYAKVVPEKDYEIMVENRTGQDLFLRLLVDGRNTLPDRSFEEGGPLRAAQYVSLTTARCWFCEKDQPEYRIRGFFNVIEASGEPATNAVFQTFRVTDAQLARDESAGSRYRQQLGVITAAFYEAVGKEASPMAARPQYATVPGATGHTTVETYSGSQAPGRLLGDAPINIHYGF